MARVDWLIVGAGLTGATFAERIANARGERVLVIDRRDHIAGNAHDYRDENGLLIHRYGPHIFHTNSDAVWTYLSRFTEWRPYSHRVRAAIDGRLTPLPFNHTGIDTFFSPSEAARIKTKLVAEFGAGAKVPILKLRRTSDGDLATLAAFVYEKVFKNYTIKQWGVRPEELSPAVTARVPILVGDDDRCFADRYQAMPRDGYTAMVARMLDHPNIAVSVGTEFQDAKAEHRGARILYSGPIDEYFGYAFGPLPYRSLTFEKRIETRPLAQPVATLNYPNDFAYTRVTEMKHMTGEVNDKTARLYEYPGAHIPGETEPYYPVPNEANQALLHRYRQAAGETCVHFCGRLGEYRYYNMDQAVASAFAKFANIADVSAKRG